MHQSSLAKILFGASMVSAAPSACMSNYNATDHVKQGTQGEEQGSGGDLAFWQYVNLGHDSHGTPATHTDAAHEQQWGSGATSFKNHKTSPDGSLDMLTIPNIWFENINKAQEALGAQSDIPDCNGPAFTNLLAGLLQAGVNSCISTENCVAPATSTMKACFHLAGHTTVSWMHLHVYTSEAWNGQDDLFNQDNTCVEIPCADGTCSQLSNDQATAYAGRLETCMSNPTPDCFKTQPTTRALII